MNCEWWLSKLPWKHPCPWIIFPPNCIYFLTSSHHDTKRCKKWEVRFVTLKLRHHIQNGCLHCQIFGTYKDNFLKATLIFEVLKAMLIFEVLKSSWYHNIIDTFPWKMAKFLKSSFKNVPLKILYCWLM